MSVFARGMLRRCVTRVYFEGDTGPETGLDTEFDTGLDTDPLLATVDPARRHTLVARREGDGYRFDVRIQGDDETVFLDVFAR
jgi:protocatechuate 3,4-dioxygenase alpha subunit